VEHPGQTGSGKHRFVPLAIKSNALAF
jgi:hypothetical protein